MSRGLLARFDDEFDLLVTPTMAIEPPPVGLLAQVHAQPDFPPMEIVSMAAFTALFNITGPAGGQPAAPRVPVGPAGRGADRGRGVPRRPADPGRLPARGGRPVDPPLPDLRLSRRPGRSGSLVAILTTTRNQEAPHGHRRDRPPAQVPAGRERDADGLVQHRARPAVAAPAGPPSRHPRARRPRRLRPAVPDGPHPPGGQPGPLRRHPRRRPRRLPAVAAHPAVPGPPPGAGPRHPGPDLLQVRGRLAGRLPQAQHRRPAGVLQRQGRGPAPDHRDRAPASGAPRWPSPVPCSASSARSGRWAPATTRSRTGG